MNIRTTWYCIKQGIINIHRNKLFSLASIGTIAACIFLIGLFYSIVLNFQYIVSNAEEQVGITVFFEKGTTEERIEEVGEQIKLMDGVTQIKYTSPEEAWATFKDSYLGDSPELAEGFKDDNPLADSANYTVNIKNIDEQMKYVEKIQKIDNVRSVKYSANTAATMSSFAKLVGYVSIAIIVILLAVGIFLISNTVMMGITVRKKEIKIMKLIGATNIFVRAPFMIEGVLIGIIGAAIPLAVLWTFYEKVVSLIVNQFSMLSSIVVFLPVNKIFITLVPMGFAVGAGIGLIGSVSSIRKHLKV
ncbi:MAG: permease-like cell division protein FtsX [Lachnospiraceae bacterium]|nr:permease-like cell division protein FtsX [Lachnospiraceae bacterium]